MARVPSLREHTVAPPALSPIPQARSLERELRAAIGASPGDARAHAALGNLLVRKDLYFDAREAYREAVAIDGGFAEAHLAIADLSSILRDNAASAEHLRRALALQRFYPDPLPIAGRIRLLMMLRDAPYAMNAPLEVILDRRRVAVHKLYVGEMPHGDLAEHDVLWCAFGLLDGNDAAVRCARALAGGEPLINAPETIAQCRRDVLHDTLAGCDVQAVRTTLVPAAALNAVPLPALIRPAGTHAGFGLARIRTSDERAAHVQRFPSPRYHVSPFVEYRSPDGYYRKYRIVLVDGVPYPYHLAISPRWMVHYQSSPMAEHEWMRQEEAAFLADPESVFPRWRTTGASLAAALELDYAGVDVTRMPDGSMLVFEADPAMLVHDEDEGSAFDYKRPYVASIREALHRAIERRVMRESRSSRETL